MISKQEIVFSTVFNQDGTARVSVLRWGTNPSTDDLAYAFAVKIADAGITVEASIAANKEVYERRGPAFEAKVREYLAEEVRCRTVPGSCPYPGPTARASTEGEG